MTTGPHLHIEGLSHSFGSHRALRDVDLDLPRGQVLGLIGENGAGKSTLLNIVSGVLAPDTGTIELAGQPIRPRSYQDANRLGIFRVFQDTSLVADLTIAENLFFGWEQLFRNRFGFIDHQRRRREAAEALESVGLTGIDVRRPVSTLGVGARQGLDVARATTLARKLEIESPVVLFDEPTTALDQSHEENFLRLLEQLEGWASVVFVSHRLQEILRSTQQVVVLKDGKVSGGLPTAEADEDTLHRLMVGRVRTANYYRQPAQPNSVERLRLRARDISVLPLVTGVSLEVAGGEILGLAGTEGSGKRVIGEAVTGAIARDTGVVEVDGEVVAPNSVSAAVDRGLVFVPADRKDKGLILSASISDNLQLPILDRRYRTRFGLWDRAAARRDAQRVVEQLGVVTRTIDTPVSALSGGNQQKVLIAKWLGPDPKAVVLDNPTQGVDTGAREGIYELIRDIAAAGAAVLLISDDLSELIGLSDRIGVVVDGAITEYVDAPGDAKPDEHAIVAKMIATSAPALTAS